METLSFLLFSEVIGSCKIKHMLFRKIVFYFFCFSLVQKAGAQQMGTVASDVNKVHLEFSLDRNGSPEYAVFFATRQVIQPSQHRRCSRACGYSVGSGNH